MQAQVTIGSGEQPAKGALLDIKEQAAGADNVTATSGGLVLPRVKLENLTTMEPFIPANDPGWTNNAQTRIKELHPGLMVYNLAANATFKPGIYIWDGARWQSSEATLPAAGNGLSIGNDTLSLGGALTKPTTLNLANNPLSLTGRDTLHISAPAKLNGPLAYLGGKNAPSSGLLFMSDNDGNASWEPRSTLPSTPSAKFDRDGVTINMKDAAVQQDMVSTHTYIELPPGRWLVVVTMHANVTGTNAGSNDWFWVRSSFIKDGETQVNPAYFEGANQLISGRAYWEDTTLNGFVVMKNPTQGTLKFYYCVGRIDANAATAARPNLNKFGSSAWKENSIVAFALAE
jgi:hypothetical protein